MQQTVNECGSSHLHAFTYSMLQVQPIISSVSELFASVDDISAGIFAPSDGQH